jgi:ferredoxin
MLCEANAVCVGLAPDVFDLDDDDELHILTDEVPADKETAVRMSVQSCPKQALKVED